MRIILTTFVVALIIFTAASMATMYVADPGRPALVTASGAIAHKIAGQFVLRNGQMVYVYPRTVFRPKAPLPVVGARITVTGYPNPGDSSINAREIDVDAPSR